MNLLIPPINCKDNKEYSFTVYCKKLPVVFANVKCPLYHVTRKGHSLINGNHVA
jgi:hypothetical protein